MTLVYFDASALVKLVIDEDGSDVAARLWDGCDAAIASRLAYVEVRAALAAAHRNTDLSESDLETALSGFTDFWASIRPLELTEPVQIRAGQVAREYSLRGADAVHLASALTVGDPHIVMAVWDRKLAAATRAAGLAVSPAPS